ncbi:hexose transporter of the major facilitator superfamily [Suhomyces tanzawaensis NRRL Y-17324]|uniref:Hexose transporter of the major facilitator superfamily n=1 Tax=Suhomyces tanzawaensis NRRL Y-17324 TaxID=984487 RepID=A0A1E4SHI9_9ASCO|nr:hexose transporter of the major facilitator superfamily [Suhomyces tanzawaensis NRRL Y-17324]ODV78945.1 hexose transporter of the major facilitator superfamily [Suhomyces tanzawaensis NRRL Y-17324]
MSSFLERPHSITPTLAWATLTICLSTFQFGYHLSELNAPSDYMGCSGSHALTACVDIPDNLIATITAMYTVGGFLVSLVLGFTSMSRCFGRKWLCQASAAAYFAGSFMMARSHLSTGLNLGRFVCGVAAGASLIMSPILVNELTPINHRGLLGSLLQVAIAAGIFTGQAVSLVWHQDQWRCVFYFALFLGLLQFAMLFTVTESPKWIIINEGDVQHATGILGRLRSDKETVFHEINHWRGLESRLGSGDLQPLLPKSETILANSLQLAPKKSRRGSFQESSVSATEFMFGKYSHQAIAVFILMTSQQLVGINAIVFYGVRILSTLFTTNTLLLSCSILLVNVVSAIGTSQFVDRVGRRPLMLFSAVTSGVFSVLIAFGLVRQMPYLIVGACYGFVICYSVGIGPIPYLMVSELASHEVVSTAQAIGTSANWGANILIAYLVPVLQDAIGGAIFYIFAAICGLYVLAVWYCVPETRGVTSHHEAWLVHRGSLDEVLV